ncbi:MAG: photosynthetic complex putative assembly protein PuhB [Pseudomonadota bacterium]
MNADDDYAFEPVPGLPSDLPDDEKVLWSGSPEPWTLGHRAFHTRWIAAFFIVLAVSSIFSGFNHGAGVSRVAMTVVTLLFLGGLVVGFLVVMGWLVAINTIYTLTNKRLIIRHGVTMPMAVNVPFTKIARADAKIHGTGAGDISVSLLDGNRLSIFAIWPHNRPWSWQGAAPAMRMVPDGAKVAKALSDALLAHAKAEEASASNAAVFEPARPKVVRTRDRYMPVKTAEAANPVMNPAHM